MFLHKGEALATTWPVLGTTRIGAVLPRDAQRQELIATHAASLLVVHREAKGRTTMK